MLELLLDFGYLKLPKFHCNFEWVLYHYKQKCYNFRARNIFNIIGYFIIKCILGIIQESPCIYHNLILMPTMRAHFVLWLNRSILYIIYKSVVERLGATNIQEFQFNSSILGGFKNGNWNLKYVLYLLHNIYVSGVCLGIKYGSTTTILLFNDIGCNGFIRTWKPNLTLSS